MRPFTKLPQWWTYGLLFPLAVLNCWLALLIFEYFRALITVLVVGLNYRSGGLMDSYFP